MKRSYIIIIALAIVFALGFTGLALYAENTGILVGSGDLDADTNDSQGGETVDIPGDGDNEGDSVGSDTEKTGEETEIVPFTNIAEKDGVIYLSRLTARSMDIDGAEVIPINSECFAIIGEDVYYITPGDEEFAPELRRCGADGNNDISITEFVSPLGAPAFIGDSIYSAYYTQVDEGMNNGFYRYNIGAGETTKAIDGEFFVYGYDRDYIYYSTNDNPSSGTELYRMDYSGDNKTRILSFPVRTDSIVVGDEYIFFAAYSDHRRCYKLYRSPKDGDGSVDEYAFECMTDRFDVIGDRMYYQAARSLYCSLISGGNESKLTDLEPDTQYAFGFLELGGNLYFAEQSSAGTRYFFLDMTTGEKHEITK